MKRAVILVGLPASGKSTFAKRYENDPSYVVLSTDKYIEKLSKINGKTYDEGFKDYINLAHQMMNELLDTALSQGLNIVWDQTNLTRKKRAQIISRLSGEYFVECIEFWPQNGEAYKKALHGRPGKTIPATVIDNMIMSYQTPSFDEGFDAIASFDTFKD